MKRLYLAIFPCILMTALSVNGGRAVASFDYLMDPFSLDKKAEKSPVNFYGLRFMIDPSNTTCQKGPINELNCRIALAVRGENSVHVEIKFDRKVVAPKDALPIIRLMRQEQWTQKNASKNQMVEEEHRAGVFPTRLQQYRYLRLDNIFWPVLIRAFDIVVDDKTIISVTTNCDANVWPLIQKEVESIELSFTRAVKK